MYHQKALGYGGVSSDWGSGKLDFVAPNGLKSFRSTGVIFSREK